MLYILHGENAFDRDEALVKLRRDLAGGDPAMAELNTTVLDGGRLTMGELQHACDSVPFMAACRLVIVHGLLTRLAAGRKGDDKDGVVEQDPAWKRTFREQLVAYLPSLPPTTQLILVEPKNLAASDPVLKVVQAEADRKLAKITAFSLPREQELVGWIQRRVKDSRGKISGDAAAMLAMLIGQDLRLLDLEIDKLVTFAGGERAISAADVQALISRARETKIFDLVDCVGRRETARALRWLHYLLEEGEHPLQLLTMLARQVRILIQVGELSKQGLVPPEIASRLALHPYVVGKAIDQAKRFDVAQLEAAHRRLVETDWAIKTGRVEETLALDLLVVEMSRSLA